MLPTKLSRAAHRAATSPPTATCYACLASRQTHQRRHSSSKASSSSADRYSNKTAGPATKAATSPAAEEQQSVSAQPETRPTQRSTKGRARIPRRPSTSQDGSKKAVPAEPVDQFAGLPSVPSVQSLSESDRSISNFFSLHRPMSITHTFPPPSTPEAFSKIFTPAPSQQDPWANGNSAERRPEDVIYTLNSTIETLENNAGAAQDDGVRWEIIHESPSNAHENGNGNVHHLDGQHPHQPRLKSLEELVAQFKPFRTPPPPQPFPEYDTARLKQKEKKTSSSSATPSGTKPKQKTFTTTITVTESTYANGRKTYSASSSPIVALADATATADARAGAESTSRGLTRRERVRKMRSQSSEMVESESPSTESSDLASTPYRATGFGWRGGRVGRMYLISVKRQRKLKMKKHKYKKLMKRTRNLRRRLERN